MRVLIIVLCFALQLVGAEAFISAQELHSRLPSDELVILDVGSHSSYHKGHIPAAIHVDISQLCREVDDHYEMQNIPQLVELVRRLGIANDSHVVIYDHNAPDGLLHASYLALALYRLGHTGVSILNGGYDEWAYEYDGVTTITNRAASDFTPHPDNELIVDGGYVSGKLTKVPILDARPAKSYYGIYKSPGVYRLGHIKGAMSSYWKNCLLSDNTLAERELLEEIYIKGFRLDPDEEVIVYGLDGYQASITWYILQGVFAFKNVKVYDASLKEWGNRDESAMVRYAWELHR